MVRGSLKASEILVQDGVDRVPGIGIGAVGKVGLLQPGVQVPDGIRVFALKVDGAPGGVVRELTTPARIESVVFHGSAFHTAAVADLGIVAELDAMPGLAFKVEPYVIAEARDIVAPHLSRGDR